LGGTSAAISSIIAASAALGATTIIVSTASVGISA